MRGSVNVSSVAAVAVAAAALSLGGCASSQGPASGGSRGSSAAAAEWCASPSQASALVAQRLRFYESAERGDRAALEDMLAEGFVFVHQSGFIETRTAYIDRLVNLSRGPGAKDWRTFTFAEDDVRVHDGRVAVWVNRLSAGKPKTPEYQLFQATEVLVQDGGRWRWVSIHSSKIGPEAWAVPLASPPKGCAVKGSK